MSEQAVLRMSIAMTFVVAAVGIGFGVASGSASIIFDGIYSLTDAVMTSVALLVSSLITQRLSERRQARLVQRFENKCAEIISVGGGRLVKTVGDEVLYIAETPAAGAEISLALAQAFTEDEILPEARVAMVWGRILSRLGDIYGPTVNLAARLTTLADPGTVLVDSMTAAALDQDERFVLIPKDAENVRGFGEILPVMLARGQGKGLVLD